MHRFFGRKCVTFVRYHRDIPRPIRDHGYSRSGLLTFVSAFPCEMRLMHRVREKRVYVRNRKSYRKPSLFMV